MFSRAGSSRGRKSLIIFIEIPSVPVDLVAFMDLIDFLNSILVTGLSWRGWGSVLVAIILFRPSNGSICDAGIDCIIVFILLIKKLFMPVAMPMGDVTIWP